MRKPKRRTASRPNTPPNRTCARPNCSAVLPPDWDSRSCPHCHDLHHYNSTINLGMAFQLLSTPNLKLLQGRFAYSGPNFIALHSAVTSELSRRTFEAP